MTRFCHSFPPLRRLPIRFLPTGPNAQPPTFRDLTVERWTLFFSPLQSHLCPPVHIAPSPTPPPQVHIAHRRGSPEFNPPCPPHLLLYPLCIQLMRMCSPSPFLSQAQSLASPSPYYFFFQPPLRANFLLAHFSLSLSLGRLLAEPYFLPRCSVGP